MMCESKICLYVFFVLMYTNWVMVAAQSEYETAVAQSLGNETVTVKVKQFSLEGARIDENVRTVHYGNQPTPLVYRVIVPQGEKPIKISATSRLELQPIDEAIRRGWNARAPRDRQR